MERSRKKEITRAWAGRDRRQGVFAVRCLASGELWVSTTRNLESQRNGVWFALRQGGHPNKAVQAAWNAHGEANFSYEVLEELSEEGSTAAGFSDRLKDRGRHWREALGAARLVG